ncbi:MAG: hypothetical protein LBO78_03445 [Rickettsiales bacterium]|jgi:hypothetical protein|nr:hypothetical protein [Rickettsiales bacterium]
MVDKLSKIFCWLEIILFIAAYFVSDAFVVDIIVCAMLALLFVSLALIGYKY